MRRARRTFEKLGRPQRLVLGMLLIGLCGAVCGLGASGRLLGRAAAQPNRPAAQNNDNEVPGSRGAKVPTDLNQIDENPPKLPPAAQAPQMTPATPATPAKPAVTCCTPGKDCPCTPGVDCPCTPGVDCPCTAGKDCACTPGVNCPAKAPQRSDFCTPGVNCPCSGGNCNHCTPGVNCPCTPYIDCPDNDGVLFDTDSAEVRADTRDKLVKFATEYKKNNQLVIVSDQELAGLSVRKQEDAKQRDTRIRVEGHVGEDEAGGVPAAQVRLSMQRAAAVKKALIEAGLPEEFIARTRGYSANCKISFRAEERQKNRAVQFVFERDRTGCAFDELKLRPPPIPLPPPKKGQKGGAGTKGGAKGGAAAPRPAGTK